MVEGSCDCGAVRYTVNAPLEEVTECNCGICRRYGSLWSYCSPRAFTVTGETDTYQRGDRMLTMHRCRVCGCVAMWLPVDPSHDRLGFNVRLLPPEALQGVPVKFCDGASW